MATLQILIYYNHTAFIYNFKLTTIQKKLKKLFIFMTFICLLLFRIELNNKYLKFVGKRLFFNDGAFFPRFPQ